jgi:competence protein CoiA
MLLAMVDGVRCEASPGLVGVCQACNSPMLPKCGPLRAKHWAHRAERRCDPWWEETDWHIAWKNRFPVAWREIVRRAENGERHIADVRTPDGRVIEFQHSPLRKEERDARESFYKSMVWVLDGLARKRDLDSFNNTLGRVSANPLVYSVRDMKCALLRDWAGRPVDVFLDFSGPILWHLHPVPEGRVILTPVPVADFIERLHKAMPFKRIRIKRNKTPAPTVPTAPIVPSPSPFRRRRHPESFQQYWRRKQRSRRRF